MAMKTILTKKEDLPINGSLNEMGHSSAEENVANMKNLKKHNDEPEPEQPVVEKGKSNDNGNSNDEKANGKESPAKEEKTESNKETSLPIDVEFRFNF